jgi:hypothetical protein
MMRRLLEIQISKVKQDTHKANGAIFEINKACQQYMNTKKGGLFDIILSNSILFGHEKLIY